MVYIFLSLSSFIQCNVYEIHPCLLLIYILLNLLTYSFKKLTVNAILKISMFNFVYI